jgi:hypothetical protein
MARRPKSLELPAKTRFIETPFESIECRFPVADDPLLAKAGMLEKSVSIAKLRRMPPLPRATNHGFSIISRPHFTMQRCRLSKVF